MGEDARGLERLADWQARTVSQGGLSDPGDPLQVGNDDRRPRAGCRAPRPPGLRSTVVRRLTATRPAPPARPPP